VDFDQVLKEVLWRLVTEGSISYRRIKLNFHLDDDGLEELRRELIGKLVDRFEVRRLCRCRMAANFPPIKGKPSRRMQMADKIERGSKRP